jgi:hypothetical protein
MAASSACEVGLLSPSRATGPEAQSYEAAEQSATRRGPDELYREELICRIRQMFDDGENPERDAAIAALARDLGHHHPDGQTRRVIDAALRIALGRGILEDHRRSLRLAAVNIDHYQRRFLKEQFLASLSGSSGYGRRATRN